jgi:hypothetical protein
MMLIARAPQREQTKRRRAAIEGNATLSSTPANVPCDLGQLPSQGRFSTASISEYGHSFHGVLRYHAKKRSSASGHERQNSK